MKMTDVPSIRQEVSPAIRQCEQNKPTELQPLYRRRGTRKYPLLRLSQTSGLAHTENKTFLIRPRTCILINA